LQPDAFQLLNLAGIVLAAITLGHLGYVIADGKGLPPRRWMILTALLAIVFLPALLLMRSNRTDPKPYGKRAWTIAGVGLLLQTATIVPEIVMLSPS
jgi:hypothetical protein